jgi:glyoxylase-like metal-dependent hydrolase (beta-lactamase superfamily II)
MWEIHAGVYLVAGGGDLGENVAGFNNGCCTYLITGSGDDCVLIDPGHGRDFENVWNHIEQKGIDPGRIAKVICTHWHNDHAAGATHFQKRGVPIAIHEASGELVDFSWPPGKGTAYRIDGDESFTPDISFSNGDTIETGDIHLRVMHTPGHTVDSSTLILERDGKTVLFVGDISGYLNPDWESDVRVVHESVKKAQALDADIACFGHYVIEKDLAGYLDKLVRDLAHHTVWYVDRYGEKHHRIEAVNALLKRFGVS